VAGAVCYALRQVADPVALAERAAVRNVEISVSLDRRRDEHPLADRCVPGVAGASVSLIETAQLDESEELAQQRPRLPNSNRKPAGRTAPRETGALIEQQGPHRDRQAVELAGIAAVGARRDADHA